MSSSFMGLGGHPYATWTDRVDADNECASFGISKRRCRAADLPDDICNPSFRATGVS